MIRFEISNLLHRRSILFIAIAAIIINCAAIVRTAGASNEYGYGYSELQEAYNGLPSDGDACISYIEEKLEALQCGSYGEDLLTSSPYQETMLYTELYDRISQAFYFDRDLDDRISEAELKLRSPLFFQGTFGYRNIQSFLRDYFHLTNIQTSIESSVGIEAATENRLSDAVIAFFAFVFSLGLLTMPKEEGSFVLLKPMKNGRARLLSAKLGALLILLFFMVTLVYGLSLMIGHFLFGIGDLSRLIQSLYGFSTSRFAISSRQYLLFFIVHKFIWAAALGCLMMCLCVFTWNSVAACVGAAAFLVLESICYLSRLPWIKYTSLIWISDTKWYFSNYYNLNFFGFPIDTFIISILVMGAVILLSGLFAYRRFSNEENIPYEKKKWRRIRILPLHSNLFLHEAYKLFVQQEGAVLIIGFLIFQIVSVYSETFYVNAYNRYYAQILTGAPSEDSEEFLAKENARFDKIYEDLAFLSEEFNAGVIKEETYQYLSQSLASQLQFEDAFHKAERQYWEISKLSVDTSNIEFVEIQVYEKVLGTASKHDYLTNAMKLAALLAIGLSAVFSVEQSSYVGILLQTSHRKNRVNRYKIILSLLFAVLAALFTFIPRFVVVGCRLGYSGLAASSKSLFFLGQTFSKLSIIQYMYVMVVICIFLSCVGALLTLFVSSRSKSRTAAILASFLLLILPTLVFGV